MLFALPRFIVFHFFVVVILSLLATNALPTFQNARPTEAEVSKLRVVEHEVANTDHVNLKKEGVFGSQMYKDQLDNEANLNRVQEQVGFVPNNGAPIHVEEGVENEANRGEQSQYDSSDTGEEDVSNSDVSENLDGMDKSSEDTVLPKEPVNLGEVNEQQTPTTNDETEFDFKTEANKAFGEGKTDFQTLVHIMEKSTTGVEAKDVNNLLHKLNPSVSWQNLNKLWNGLRPETLFVESLDVNLLKKATDSLLSSDHISKRDAECFINAHYYLHNQEQIDAVFNEDTLTRFTSKVTLAWSEFRDLVQYLESDRFTRIKSKELLEIMFSNENIAKQLSPSRNDIDLYEMRFILDNAPAVEKIKNLIYDEATLKRAMKASGPIYFNHFAEYNKLDPEILKNVLLNPENVKEMFASRQREALFFYPKIVELAFKAGNPNNILDLLLGNKPDLLNAALFPDIMRKKMDDAKSIVSNFMRQSPSSLEDIASFNVENKYDALTLLKLKPDATVDDINAAYKKLILQSHPDKNPGKNDLATEATKNINKAKSILLPN